MTKLQTSKKGKAPQPEGNKETTNREVTVQPDAPQATPEASLSQQRRMKVESGDEAESSNWDPSSDHEPIPPEHDPALLLADGRKEKLKAIAELERLREENTRLRLGGQPLTVSIRPAAELQCPFNTELPIGKLSKYYGKHIFEHFIWTASAKNTFILFQNTFVDDGTKIRYAAQFLKGKPKKEWFTHARTLPPEKVTWKYFSTFLLDLIVIPANRSLTVALDYHKAKQAGNQSVHSFDAYLASLESHLPELPEQHLAMNFLVRLRPNLIEAISKQAPLPETRNTMVALAARLENARKRRLSSATEQKPQRNNKRTRDKSPTFKYRKTDYYFGPRNKNPIPQQRRR